MIGRIAIEPFLPRHRNPPPPPPPNRFFVLARLVRAVSVVTARGMLLPVIAFALLLPMQVQAQTAVCSNTPAPGERIECMEDSTSTSDIDINLQSGVDITTSDNAHRAIRAYHTGVGDVTVNVKGITGANTINTSGTAGMGIDAASDGKGSVDITLSNVNITTTGQSGEGVVGSQFFGVGDFSPYDGEFNLNMDIRESRISTMGDQARAIVGNRQGREGSISNGTMNVTVADTEITTTGTFGIGIDLFSQDSAGDTILNVTNSVINVAGSDAIGIRVAHSRNTGPGAIIIKATGGSIRTGGVFTHGITGQHTNVGDLTIDARNINIVTEGTELRSGITLSTGIYGLLSDTSTGNIDIDARGGSIRTKGAFSYGIYGDNHGLGQSVVIDTHDGHSIITEGPNGHGIVAYHRGTGDMREISITSRGTVETTGDGSQGIRVGALSGSNASRVATFDEEGYRRQTVTVNGSVKGNAVGVFMAGGGRIVIGPRGSIDAESGIAILATGDTPGADPANDPAIKPKLRVDLNLGGRRVAEALGDNWILNDGGETTIAMNGVVLHDGATGSTGHRAPNGVWDVWMREEGVTVTDRMDPDPANWSVSEATTGVIADRDFSAQDFTESRARCPRGQIGFPNCMVPPPPEEPEPPPEEPEMLTFVEEYAPRSVVYEALSGALLRLDAHGLPEGHLVESGAPLWVRLSGGSGSFEADHATVGAEYDFDRFSAEAGLNVSLGGNFTGIASIRGVRGDADVNAPTGGGEIEMDGAGVTLGVSYNETNAYYARGRFSLAYYDLDLSSDTRGHLKEDLDARSRVLDLEAGRRMAMHGKMAFTPRLWARHSRVDVDAFTDAVGVRVSMDDETRFSGGIGVIAEGQCVVENGELFLRGSVDLEQTFSGSTTRVDVSGTRLSSETTQTRLLLGLGGAYQRGAFSVKAGVFAEGPDSDDESYAGHVRLGWVY